jgi:hypothetical protein
MDKGNKRGFQYFLIQRILLYYFAVSPRPALTPVASQSLPLSLCLSHKVNISPFQFKFEKLQTEKLLFTFVFCVTACMCR